MRRLTTAVLTTVLLAFAAPALALLSGTDIIVPAAGRGAPWGTDLYVANPGDDTVTGTISWLVRGQANPNPMTVAFSLTAGETAIYEDIIFVDFGLASGNGAFRVEASGPVIVNSRIFSSDGSETFGQGFEGVPAGAATQSGGTATAVGLSFNSAFRTNVYATAGASGATIAFSLLAPDGSVLATADLTLGAWEPYLRRVDQLFSGVADFDNATLTAEVTAGSVVVGASKVDNASGDPTTLESDATAGGSASIDGTYQISLYDQATYAAGGNIVIANGVVEEINGTYFNFDKLDGLDPACTLQFLWGISLAPTPVEDFASTVTFSDSYVPSGSGVMEWQVTFTIDSNQDLSGTVVAEGSNFTRDDELGCNGLFPALELRGGKSD